MPRAAAAKPRRRAPPKGKPKARRSRSSSYKSRSRSSSRRSKSHSRSRSRSHSSSRGRHYKPRGARACHKNEDLLLGMNGLECAPKCAPGKFHAADRYSGKTKCVDARTAAFGMVPLAAVGAPTMKKRNSDKESKSQLGEDAIPEYLRELRSQVFEGGAAVTEEKDEDEKKKKKKDDPPPKKFAFVKIAEPSVTNIREEMLKFINSGRKDPVTDLEAYEGWGLRKKDQPMFEAAYGEFEDNEKGLFSGVMFFDTKPTV